MDEIIREARERFNASLDGTRLTRDDAYEDMRFARLADQWPADIRKQRQAEGRPCLTINKLPSFIRQVVNDSRQNKPAISVHPIDNGADIETADVISGIIRSIERRSNAAVAYDTAIDHAASGGMGFFQIGIDYVHPDSFDLEARIKRIPNPLMVYWDPSSTEFDASDWDYAFVTDWLSHDEFAVRYGKKATKVDWDTDERASEWWQEDKTRIADYWLREPVTRKIFMLSNGLTMREEELTDEIKAIFEVAGVQVLREREVQTTKVVRRTVNGAEVLDQEDWPGSTIPICPVWGEEVILDGRRHFRSMIRDAKDPQTMFNFWRTASTELVALAPKAPFIGPAGFARGNEDKWGTANTRSHSYLEYQGDQMPQRQPFAGVPAGALQEALNSSDDMKSVTGIFDAGLGAKSNETSGRAILARQRESDVSNFHFIDNLSRAIQYAGRVLVEIIPSVYSQRQTIRILGDDEAEKVVKLASRPKEVTTSSFERVKDGELGTDGKPVMERLYNLTTGIYDVVVDVGPSYQTQREETRETLLAIMREVPGAAQFIGDLAVDAMDFPNAQKIAGRLRMLLPPQIQQAEGYAMPAPMGMPMPGAMPGMPAPNPGLPGQPGLMPQGGGPL